MISRHDIAMDGQISFAEFKKIFEENEQVSNVSLTKQDSIFKPLMQPVTPALPSQKQKLMPQ